MDVSKKIASAVATQSPTDVAIRLRREQEVALEGKLEEFFSQPRTDKENRAFFQGLLAGGIVYAKILAGLGNIDFYAPEGFNENDCALYQDERYNAAVVTLMDVAGIARNRTTPQSILFARAFEIDALDFEKFAFGKIEASNSLSDEAKHAMRMTFRDIVVHVFRPTLAFTPTQAQIETFVKDVASAWDAIPDISPGQYAYMVEAYMDYLSKGPEVAKISPDESADDFVTI